LHVRIVGLIPSEWNAYIDSLRKNPTMISTAFDHAEDKPFITHSNDGYIGSTSELISWSKQTYGMGDPRNDKKAYNTLRHRFKTIAEEELVSYMQVNKSKNTYVYFDFQLGDVSERVVMELYRHACPLAVENMRQLCTGEAGQNADGVILNYKGSLVHRIIPDAFVQLGDIATGKGDTNTTVSGDLLPDESFIYQHSGPGVVALANQGTRHTNGSQFYITLREFPALDAERQVVGRVISGLDVVKRIADMEARNQRPAVPLAVASCGDYTAFLDEQAKNDPTEAPKPPITSDAGTVIKLKGPSPRPPRDGLRMDVLVVGLDGAGKTSVVNVFRHDYDPHVTPTNGFEVDEVEFKGNNVNFLCLGGNAKIRGIWPHYYADVHGVVYVIDAKDRSKLDASIAELKKILSHGKIMDKPVLVLLNKYDGSHDPRTDISDYIEAYEVESMLSLDTTTSQFVSIQSSSCKPHTNDGALHPQDQSALDSALHWLCHEVDAAYSTLSARVCRDVDQREAELRRAREEKRARAEAKEAEA
jgi:small GTP-binding protein